MKIPALLIVPMLLLAGCGDTGPGVPRLPLTATPGWTRASLVKTTMPAGTLSPDKAECWKATYAGKGSAGVWACGFASEGTAFEAMQKGRAEANTVKFQEGKFFVVVQWQGVSRDDITALVRAIQRDLKVK